jgi:hypothetical protein
MNTNTVLFKKICETYEYSLHALNNAAKLDNKREAQEYFDKIGRLLHLIKDLHLLKAFCDKYPNDVYKIIDHIIFSEPKNDGK